MERSYTYNPAQSPDSDEARLEQLRQEVKNHMMALMIKISGLRQAGSTRPSRLIGTIESPSTIRTKLEKLKQEVDLWSKSCTQLIDRSLHELDREYTPTFTSEEPPSQSSKVKSYMQRSES